MKAGINMMLWTDFVSEERYLVFSELKKAGYDGVEIPLFQGDSGHYRRIKEVLNQEDLLSTASTGGFADKNFTFSRSGDKDGRVGTFKMGD